MTTLRPGPAMSPTLASARASFATFAAALLSLLPPLLLLVPATAYESFKVAAPALGALSSRPVVIGSNWAAYFHAAPYLGNIAVMDTATRQITGTIPIPPANVPIPSRPGWYRTTNNFGLQLVTDSTGSYLATFSAAGLAQTPNAPLSQTTDACVIHVWKMPGVEYVGAVDVDAYPLDFNHFVGIGNGRLAFTSSLSRRILQWNIETLAPLPTITLPAELPTIDNDFIGAGSMGMSGDDLVITGRDDSYVRHLLHIKLSTGVITDLPAPPSFGNRLFKSVCVAGGHLLATTTPPSTGAPVPMLHYDLATAQIVAETSLPSGAGHLPFLSRDGSSWAAVSIFYDDNGKPSELRTGAFSNGAGTGTAPFQIPPDSVVTGSYSTEAVPFSFAQGYLWYRGGVDADGTVAYRIPATVQPAAFLTARCLRGEESDGHLKFLLTLSKPVDHEVTLGVRTLDSIGSATSGSDYQPVDGSVTFAANETQALAEVPLIQDNMIEENETLVLEISSHPADILASETRIPGIIGGSSFHRLPPIAPWKDAGRLDPRVVPYDLALAGTHLVQTNKAYAGSPGDAPRVLTRPLAGGEWTPSTTLASIPVTDHNLYTNDGGVALLVSNASIRVYQPATDTLRFETPGIPSGDYPTVILGDTHFIPRVYESPIKEYALTAPYASRSPLGSYAPTSIGVAAYAQDVLIGSFNILPYGGLHLISRSTRADLGQFIPGWRDRPSHIAAGGNIFAGAYATRAWFRLIDQPGRLIPLLPAYGPLLNVTDIRVSGNRIFITDAPSSQAPSEQPPTLRVFEASTGLECGILLADRNDAYAGTDLSAYLPEGIAAWDASSVYEPSYELKNLTFGGKNIVASLRWSNLTSGTDLVAAPFTQEANLPGIVDHAAVREESGTMTFALTEAAPFPLTLTTRAVPAWNNDAADWTGSGYSVVIPAGTTSFSTGMGPLNDRLPEGTIESPIEITIAGNGMTRTIRTSVQVLDDDQIPLSAVTHSIEDLRTIFTPVAGGWAYYPVTAGSDERLIAWSGDPAFTHGSSFGAGGNRGFANAIASTGDWLAITQDAWGTSAKNMKPSQIEIYQPATKGKTPVRVLKGMKDINNFGKALYARDQTLWVGAPGSKVISPKAKTTAGQVLQYDLPTGKKTRTFKAPKTHAVGFGSSITANDTSVWIGSPVSGGAVFQYDRAKGKLLHTLLRPTGAGEESHQIFGRLLAANSTTVVADSNHTGPLTLRGYSEITGQLLWDLAPPAGRRFEHFTFVSDEILATGGDSLIFYRLPPGGAPELLVEVLIDDDGDDDDELRIYQLAAAYGQLALFRSHYGTSPFENLFLALSDIGKLAPYLPNLPASLSLTDDAKDDGAPAALTTGTTPSLPLPPVLALSRTTTGVWQLQLPSAAEAVATSTTVQCSTDLSTWDTLATPAADGSAWQLVPDALPEGPVIIGGTALQVPPDLPQLFFRLHTP